MSTTSLRALAVAVAAIIAVLTGVATGLLSGAKTCTVTQANPTAVTTSQAVTGGGTGSGLGDAQKPAASPAQNNPAQNNPTQNTLAATPSCTKATFGAEPALTAFVGALFVGGALLLLLLMASRARPTPVAPRTPSPNNEAEADRKTLIKAAIYVRDRVTSKALADRLGAALHDAGVQTLEPTGARFDPAHHEAGGATPSDDPSKVGSIAAVEVPGYADRGGRILRAPVVTVYQNHARRDRTRGDHR